MKTEITPKIRSGFFINETELARIKDAVNDQFKKINGVINADFSFEVKYINGGIVQHTSLSDITAEENDGSKRVIRLSIIAQSVSSPETSVKITFSDQSHEVNSDEAPISYAVSSDDQDWTFVTSSTIEERINKIRTSKFAHSLNNGRIFRLIPIFCMIIFMAYLGFSFKENSEIQADQIKLIRKHSKDMWEYMYQIDLMRSSEAQSLGYPIIFFPLIFFSFGLEFLLQPILRWLPNYTFYWGDRIKYYDSKIIVLRFIFGGIILAIVLGVLGNYLYDKVLR